MGWRSLEDYTPFARALVTFMWEQRPPLLPAQFADTVGISRQHLSRMLNQDAAPEPASLIRMAAFMNMPLRELMLLAGYISVETPVYTYQEAWTMVLDMVQSSPAIAEEQERAAILATLTNLRKQTPVLEPVSHQ